jgi:hypothetical protein
MGGQRVFANKIAGESVATQATRATQGKGARIVMLKKLVERVCHLVKIL